jgi:cytosine/adenosine deaminase-related metal-dependent hydrolase
VSDPRRVVIEGCAVATVDALGSEHDRGYIVIEGNRIAAVGPGPVPLIAGADRIDAAGCLATPGLVNCHHHLFQWLTRGRAQDAGLFEWLAELYPLWALLDSELVGASARAGLAALALSGCSTSVDHHYVFPAAARDALLVEVEVAAAIGLRLHAGRGSMDLGRSRGGLPPDEITETIDDILSSTQDVVDRLHDESFDAMVRIAVAPCSPFSVTSDLMVASADMARAENVRLHTHLAETAEEERYCFDRYGMRPVEYLEDLGWLGDDVWLAHCIHLSGEEITRFGATQTGVAHCPGSNARLAAGMAPVLSLLQAGAPVGLGVDGAASNEQGSLRGELRHALYLARLRDGAHALTSRRALELATMGGARCLGREDAIGSLEVDKLADIALWRLDDLGHAGIEDPVAALVLGPTEPVRDLFVDGRRIVAAGELLTVSVTDAARDLEKSSRRLLERAESKP